MQESEESASAGRGETERTETEGESDEDVDVQRALFASEGWGNGVDDVAIGGGDGTCGRPRPECLRRAKALKDAKWMNDRLRVKLEEAEDLAADGAWDNNQLRLEVAELQRIAQGGAAAGDRPDWMGRNGLRNLGRTCYMNGILQLLFAAALAAGGLEALVGALRAVRSPLHDVELAEALAVVLAQMASPTHPGGVVDPRAFFARFGASTPAFRGRRWDQDATEFLLRLLELTTLGAVGREDSVVTSTTTTCGRCDGRSRRDETSFTLHVEFDETRPPGETPSLQALIDRTRRTETLDAENMYACSNCATLQPATRRVEYERLPAPVLFIHVKRFVHDTHSGVTRKIRTRVTYGDDLRIVLRNGEIVTYRPLAVLMHDGKSPSTGHYYTYVRLDDGSMLEMNDGAVRPAGRVADTHASQAYMFAYERVDTPAPTLPALAVRQPPSAAGAPATVGGTQPRQLEAEMTEGTIAEPPEADDEGDAAGQQVCVCAYVYMCVCVCVYIYIYIYIYTHTYIYI